MNLLHTILRLWGVTCIYLFYKDVAADEFNIVSTSIHAIVIAFWMHLEWQQWLADKVKSYIKRKK